MPIPQFSKFGGPDLDKSVPYDYGNRWCRNDHETWSCLLIGPSADHIDLILKLAKAMPPPYGLLWVLVLPASDHDPGRYQSPRIETYAELEQLLRKYQDFFEHDGRHHLWIASPDSGAQLIYDNHNIIYAYGPLDDFAALLRSEGLTEAPVKIPSPHTHGYNPANAAREDEFFAEFPWRNSPLVAEFDDP